MKFRWIATILLLFLCLCGCVGLPLLIHTPYPDTSKDIADLAMNWEVAVADSPLQAGGLSRPPAESADWQPLAEQAAWLKQNQAASDYWLRKQLPDHAWRDPHLFVSGQKVAELFMDETPIYTSGIGPGNEKTNELFRWMLVPLSQQIGGKTLYVHAYTDRVNPLFGTYLLGNATDLHTFMLKQDSVKLALSVLFFTFGIGSLCLFAANHEEKVHLYFCCFSMLLVAGSLARTHLVQGLIHTPPADYFQDLFIPFTLLTLLFLLHTLFKAAQTKAVHDIASSLTLAFALVCLAAAMIHPYLYKVIYAYGFPYVLLAAFALSLWKLAQLYKGASPQKRKEIGILGFGYSVIALLLLFHLIHEFITPFTRPLRSMFPLLSHYGQDDQIFMGAFVFDVCLCLVLLYRFSDTHRTARESAIALAAKNEELQAMDLLKDEFLAKTSHELRMPLEGMIGIVESLQDGAPGTMREDVRSQLSMVIRSGRRLSRLIGDMLDYSKLKHHNLEISIKRVGILQITDVVLTALKPQADQKQVLIMNDMNDSLPYVAADEDRIQQVLFNLVGNAVKFTNEGHVRVFGEARGGFVSVSVSDTGIGIAEEHLSRIFESFEQRLPSSSSRYEGTGLGLSISKKFIELHGGELTVSSTEGAGSTFTFTLPVWQGAYRDEQRSMLYEEEIAAAMLTEHEPSAGTNAALGVQEASDPIRPVILVVDDETIHLEIAAAHLGMPYRVVKASSAKAALHWIEQNGTPDLVLSDVMMPDKTGYELCKELRQKYNPAELPILLLTSRDQPQDLIQGFDAGANDYMTKPVSRQELLARVHQHLELGRLNRSLEELVRLRTSELEQTYRQLQTSMRETFEALGEVAIWEERNRIAQDIHDILGHKLTGTIVQIEAAKRLMAKSPDTALQKLELAQETVRKGLDDIRVAVRMMKDDIGKDLSSMLIELMEETAEMTGVTIDYDISELPDLDAMQKKIIYHALQEGLTNGIKHGKSSLFFFKLGLEDDLVSFQLLDDGVPYADSPLGFGLTAMKEKVRHLGGTIHIGPASTGGSQLGIWMPVRE